MAEDYRDAAPATARFAGHPIHPMLMPFPLVLLSVPLLTDITYLITGDGFWALASRWLVAAGLVTGVIAAVPGLIDFSTIRRARAHLAGWMHLAGNVAVLGLALVSTLLRWGDPAGAVLPSGVILSAVIAGLLVVTSWFGGELAYRYKIGTFDQADSGDPSERRA
jgi:uncharacterized membrane protein